MGGCERVKLELHSPSSLASGQLWAVREGGQSHYSRTLCRNAGRCVTHADPASDRQRDARAGSLRSPSLPHRGYVSGFVGVTSTVLGGLASAPQPVSLAPPYHQTRLCDSATAFSVDNSCLQFGPADSQIILRPRPGYVPKVPTTPFRDQVVSLQALPPEEADPALALLCPVRALRHYVDRTQSFRTSDQLFVCHGGQQKGNAVSKQRMAHWIVDAITLAYQAQGVPCPFRLRAHSTRSVASSWALARGASLTDICRAAGWATPNTFARFYSLRVEPVSSCVLTSNG